MHLQYALYERAERGYCWTWRSADLSEGLLDDFRYRIDLPSDANSILPDHLRGGICKFARNIGGVVQEHVVLYRFFDGGSDAGRPNRIVMLSAWASPSQIASMPMPYAIAAVFRNRMFDYVSTHSREVHIAEPPFVNSLTAEEEWDSTKIPRMPSTSLSTFIDEALKDVDNDYVLTIKDNDYSLRKKPSVVLDSKQRPPEASPPPRSSLSNAETAVVRTNTPSITDGGAGRQAHWMQGIAKGVVSAVVILALLAVAWLAIKGGGVLQGGGAILSAQAEQLVGDFKKLSPDEQERVLRELERVYGRRQSQTTTPAPSPYFGGAAPQQIPANGLPNPSKSRKK